MLICLLTVPVVKIVHCLSAELLMCLQESVDRGKEIEYVVKRLICGLSSSRECARLGFSTVLTHVRLAELIPHFAC